MVKGIREKLTAAFALALVCCLLSAFSDASEAPPGARKASVYVDGILNTSCALLDGLPYMTQSEFESALELTEPLPLELLSDGRCLALDGRCLFMEAPARSYAGFTFYPVSALAWTSSCTTQFDPATGILNIDSTRMAPLSSGDDFYDPDDLYWLSRIIHAESGNQPLEGMLGVGNVVLNRAASPLFPDTVTEVIFDTRFGIQFSPVESGSIYNEPGEAAVLAARLCLEGCDVAGNSLYFVNPELCLSSWFSETRTFVVRIGDHDFYS